MGTIRVFFIVCFACICFSCNNRETYYLFNEIKDARWSKSHALYFEIDSTLIDTSTKYDLSIECVNNTEYLYQNLWLYVQLDSSESDSNVEQIEYMLADSLGRWQGSGFGSTYQLSLSYKQGVSFPSKKNYKIKIIHGMTDEPLAGIEKIGLKLQPSKIDNNF